MFGFGRKKKSQTATADTFVKATGGSWNDIPDVVTGDGGEHADYVGEILRKVSEYAIQEGVAVGEEFAYTLTEIPHGITSPHEVIFPLMMRAHEYGLRAGFMHDETAHFVRTK